jgi:hypothetical protein
MNTKIEHPNAQTTKPPRHLSKKLIDQFRLLHPIALPQPCDVPLSTPCGGVRSVSGRVLRTVAHRLVCWRLGWRGGHGNRLASLSPNPRHPTSRVSRHFCSIHSTGFVHECRRTHCLQYSRLVPVPGHSRVHTMPPDPHNW